MSDEDDPGLVGPCDFARQTMATADHIEPIRDLLNALDSSEWCGAFYQRDERWVEQAQVALAIIEIELAELERLRATAGAKPEPKR